MIDYFLRLHSSHPSRSIGRPQRRTSECHDAPSFFFPPKGETTRTKRRAPVAKP